MEHYVSDHAVAIETGPGADPAVARGRWRKGPITLAVAATLVLVVAAVAVAVRFVPGTGAGPADAAGASAPAAAQPEDRPVRAATACASCGTVESVRPVEVKRATGTATVYRVTVRMDDGSYRAISHPTPPGIGAGEKVRIVDGAVLAGR